MTSSNEANLGLKKTLQITDSKSTQHLFVSTEVQSEQEKSFLEIRRHDLCLKFDFSGDCSKNLISTSALSLSFDLKEHHTEVSAQLILISVIKQSARTEKQTNQ